MEDELRSVKQRIPWVMAAGRAVLGPVMILGERARWNGLTLAMLVLTALLSDIFDGVLARRWRCDTAGVRLFDSAADIVFYAGCAIALWMRHPGLVHALAVPIGAVAGLEAAGLAIALVKFGKLPSYHSYLAKAWGLALASALVAAFLARNPAGWVVAALIFGALAELEGIAMSLIMPIWRQDVMTLRHACELRRQTVAMTRRADPGVLTARDRVVASRSLMSASIAALLGLGLLASAAHAASISAVKFIGGSTPGIATGTEGSMDTDVDEIRFRWALGSLAIPYTQIQNFSYRDTKAVKLGLLPAIAVLLVRPPMHRHIVTLSYLDESGKKQVAVFEVPKRARDTLPVILQERTGLCLDQYQLPCRAAAAPFQSRRP